MNKPGPHKHPSTHKNLARGVVTKISSRRKNRVPLENSDAIALSSPMVNLQLLKSAIEQHPEINAAKIIDLHHRISNNEYKINAKKLASKLLAFEKSLDTP